METAIALAAVAGTPIIYYFTTAPRQLSFLLFGFLLCTVCLLLCLWVLIFTGDLRKASG